MVKFLLFCALLICCWPLALAFLVIAPIVWLVLLPFKLAFLALHLVIVLLTLPFKILKVVF